MISAKNRRCGEGNFREEGSLERALFVKRGCEESTVREEGGVETFTLLAKNGAPFL